METKDRDKIALRSSFFAITVDLLLSAFKLFAGIVGNSMALVADAVHSLADTAGAGIMVAGAKEALDGKQPSDRHERNESIAEIILAAVVFAVGAGIGYSGVLRVFAGHYDEIIVPGILALIAAIVSVAVTEGLYWYTRTKAKKINSGALMADAWHHRFAVVPSVIALIGIAGAMLGVRILEPIASVIICLFILKSALSIFLGAIAKLTDRAADDATVEELRGLITEQEGVLSIDTLRTRMFDHELYIDAEIGVNGDLNLRAGHRIARTVREAVEAEIPKVRRCAVHVIPAEKAGEEQAEEMPK